MSTEVTPSPLTALVYGEGRSVDLVILRIVTTLHRLGQRCAGFIQIDRARPDRARCDMLLQNLTTGARLAISQDRGPLARGCQLDVDALLGAMEAMHGELASGPDLLVINKFGKTEAEGGGFRPLITAAVELGVPVLIAVPWRNVEPWRAFAGDLAVEHTVHTLLPLSNDQLCRRLALGQAQPQPDLMALDLGG
jgi:nucleoside-triphosphatase THEP1